MYHSDLLKDGGIEPGGWYSPEKLQTIGTNSEFNIRIILGNIGSDIR